MTDKPALRARLRAIRDRFVTETYPQPPAPHPCFIDRLCPGLVIASYASLGSEADPGLWEAAARAAGCTLALPHVVDRATPLRFREWPDGAALDDGPFGLSNPRSHWQEIAPDMIITPLLGFDAALNRLGQGAGHYDRAFATYPSAWRVGLAWSVQELAMLPIDAWDIPLQAIVTERDHWSR